MRAQSAEPTPTVSTNRAVCRARGNAGASGRAPTSARQRSTRCAVASWPAIGIKRGYKPRSARSRASSSTSAAPTAVEVAAVSADLYDLGLGVRIDAGERASNVVSRQQRSETAEPPDPGPNASAWLV